MGEGVVGSESQIGGGSGGSFDSFDLANDFWRSLIAYVQDGE